MLISHYT